MNDSVRMPATNALGDVVAWVVLDRPDAERLSIWRWHLVNGRAHRTVHLGVSRRKVAMHREILGLGPGDPDVDHRNRDMLDNRRINLRAVTKTVNNQNRDPDCDVASSSHRGVGANAGKWRARVSVGGKQHHLGMFDTEDEAAAAATAFRAQHHDDPQPPPRVDALTLPIVWTSDGRARRYRW